MKLVFFITFFVFIFFIALMAIGLLAGKTIKGSCGGLGKLQGIACLFCRKKDKCERVTEDSGDL